MLRTNYIFHLSSSFSGSFEQNWVGHERSESMFESHVWQVADSLSSRANDHPIMCQVFRHFYTTIVQITTLIRQSQINALHMFVCNSTATPYSNSSLNHMSC